MVLTGGAVRVGFMYRLPGWVREASMAVVMICGVLGSGVVWGAAGFLAFLTGDKVCTDAGPAFDTTIRGGYVFHNEAPSFCHRELNDALLVTVGTIGTVSFVVGAVFWMIFLASNDGRPT